MQDERRAKELKPVRAVLVKLKQGQTWESMMRFTDTFLIGRHDDNDLQIKNPCVSRSHVRIQFDGEHWSIKDLGSVNGTFIDGIRIQEVPLSGEAEVELGKGGPVLSLKVEEEEPGESEEEVTKSTEGFASATQIVKHYFTKSKSLKEGLQTLMFRRAFDRVHKKRSKKYRVIIGACLLLLLTSGSLILYQKNKLHKLRNTAIDIFYSMKSLELQIGQLEEVVLMKADKNQLRELKAKQDRLKEMEKNYDHFVEELGIYKKMREEERLILRMARIFGECDVNVPKGFVKEVKNYIEKWKSSTRLKEGIGRAKMNRYIETILKTLEEYNLSPHFFYLPLQESGFETRAVGPKTRYGYAKGIWQFIPLTAKHYGLQIGPLHNEKAYDPRDERFDFEKATKAAAKYIKDLNNTEAQASGLLILAAYNWGETRVREVIRRMPENPKERNFWLLLMKERIPQETYDYVFYIFSAAVICENPRLFGFDFDGPLS
jgi:membrane-bound lytic murein transglycosylase D